MAITDLAQLRTDYAGAESALGGEQSALDPVELFAHWFDEAIAEDMAEPNAMALATATLDAKPSVRTVLVKGFDEAGLVFFTNYSSRKGKELDQNPYAAATMLWHSMHRQVRIEGPVMRIDSPASDSYFASRPRGSQISAAASPQSEPVTDRGELQRLRAAVEEMYGDGPITRPEFWGGYRIGWDVIEFWQGRGDRLHDRLQFQRSGELWSSRWLAP